MDLLAFAKGPLLHLSVVVFIVGIVWRLTGIFLLRGKRNLSEPRNVQMWKGLRLTALRSWPRKEFMGPSALWEANSYIFHFALFAVVLFGAPHILFLADIFKGLLGFDLTDIVGFGWPNLPGGVLYFLSAVSIVSLLAALCHRLVNPVKRLISNFDDYFTWFVTIAPLVTGLLTVSHLGAPYQTLLALHVLSIDLLLLWFPFGKLLHPFTMFVVRGVTGVMFERKGAAL